MRMRIRWVLLAALILSLGAPLVWASSSDAPTLTPSASEDWSRGRVMGMSSVKRRVAIQTVPDVGSAILWPNLDGRLELALVGIDGELLLDRVLPLAEKAVDPQLRVGSDGRFHVLWREEGTPYSARYALLEPDGTSQGHLLILSDPERGVLDSPRLVIDAAGGAHALWTDDTGIRWAALSAEGEVVRRPSLLIPGGTSPQVQPDDTGRLHLVWQQEDDLNVLKIFYATLDPHEARIGQPQEIAEILTSGRLAVEDVSLGLSADRAYVLWSEYDRSFDRFIFRCVEFPLEDVGQREDRILQLRMGVGPEDLASLDGQQTPVAIAVSERVMASGDRVESQVGVMNLDGAEPVEEIVTGSSQASLRAALTADESSDLHMVWLDSAGFRQYRVVYASTSPGVIEAYDVLLPEDAVNAVFNSLFRLSLVIVGAFPGLTAWALVPFLGLVAYHLVTSEETLETTRSQAALAVVIALEVILSFAVPLRIGLEGSWDGVRWLAPGVSTALALLVTVVVRRRKDSQLFSTFLLFTVVNTVLQMSMYLLL